LCVDYGKLRALRSIDFEVGESEIVAVLGANGAGKTSLARALTGLVPAAAGQISFAGEDLTRTPAYKRARQGIAICHEGRRLFTGMKVRREPLSQPTRALDEHRKSSMRASTTLSAAQGALEGLCRGALRRANSRWSRSRGR
jgi:ABC-type branched-subunit amino acid transport system ATPase component